MLERVDGLHPKGIIDLDHMGIRGGVEGIDRGDRWHCMDDRSDVSGLHEQSEPVATMFRGNDSDLLPCMSRLS